MAKRPEDRYRQWAEVREGVPASPASGSAEHANGRSSVTDLVERANARQRKHVEEGLTADAAARGRDEQVHWMWRRLTRWLGVCKCLLTSQCTNRRDTRRARRRPRQGVYAQHAFAPPARVSFFAIDPPLKLKAHSARFAPRIADSNGAASTSYCSGSRPTSTANRSSARSASTHSQAVCTASVNVLGLMSSRFERSSAGIMRCTRSCCRLGRCSRRAGRVRLEPLLTRFRLSDSGGDAETHTGSGDATWCRWTFEREA